MIDEPTQAFIRAHRQDNIENLSLQASRHPDVNMRKAVTQIEGWRIATIKIPTWSTTEGIIYPPRISMEQCSSETTALYKASLVCGERLTDLTGGFGIDCSYMSERFSHTTYIESNTELCRIAAHNFTLLGHNIQILNGDCEKLLPELPEQDWLFIDPARRDGTGRKVAALSDCTPDIIRLESLLLKKAANIMVKCSPMLDISHTMRQLSSIREVHVVSVKNECKELLFILGRNACSSKRPIQIHTINFHGKQPQNFTFTLEEEATSKCNYTANVLRYLYEPNSSLMKAGGFNTLGTQMGLLKLHPNTHLYTSNAQFTNFPGRIFEVKDTIRFSKQELHLLRSKVKNANLTVRNFPESVDRLRKRLKIKDGGDEYIFATTLEDTQKVLLLCTKK